MDISFEIIIATASKLNAFRQKYLAASSSDPELSVWNVINSKDAKEILSITEVAESFDRGEVAKACTSLLMKTYALTLDKQDPEVVELIKLRGNSLFARYSNIVSMEAVDLLTSQNKFMPNIAEITECLEKVDAEQTILFKRAEAASKEDPVHRAESPLKSVGGFADSMKRELQSIIDGNTFSSWSHSFLDFRYLERAETVLAVVKSNFYVNALRRFEGQIIKAAEKLGLKARYVSFKLPGEMSTNNPSDPHFETSKFRRELYLMAEPWIRGSIEKIIELRINGKSAHGIVSVFDVCNTLTRFLQENAFLAAKRIYPNLENFEFIAEGRESWPKNFEEPTQKQVYGRPMTIKEYDDFIALIERIKRNPSEEGSVEDLVKDVTKDMDGKVKIRAYV